MSAVISVKFTKRAGFLGIVIAYSNDQIVKTCLKFCFFFSFVAASLLFSHAVFAGCPFHSGGDTVTYTINNVDTVSTDMACSGHQGNDCDLFAVINYINTTLSTDQTVGGCYDSNSATNGGDPLHLLKGSTLILRFANTLSSVTPTTNKWIWLKLPPSLGKVTIDGDLGSGKKLVVKPGYYGVRTSICFNDANNSYPACTTPDAATDVTDIEIRNMEFQENSYGLHLTPIGGNAVITLSQLNFLNSSITSVYLMKAPNVKLSMTGIDIESPKAALPYGIYLSSVSLQEGNFDGIVIKGSSTAAPIQHGFTLNRDSEKGGSMTFNNIVMDKVTTGFDFKGSSSSGSLEKIDLENSNIHFKTTGISFNNVSNTPPNTVTIKNSVISGLYTGTDVCPLNSSAISVYDSMLARPTNWIRNIAIEKNTIGGACKGLLLNGNIIGVTVDGNNFKNIAGNAIEADGIGSEVNLQPQYIDHDDNTFENVSGILVRYTSGVAPPTAGTIFDDDLITDYATDFGVDTPPLNAAGSEIKLFRKSTNLNWLKVGLKYFDGMTGMELLWKSGNSYYPVTIANFTKTGCSSGICDYTAEATFAAGSNPPPFTAGTLLTDATVRFAMRAKDPSLSIVLASMFTDDIPVVNADWVDAEVIHVDNSQDDSSATLNGCKENVANDCSLRGAIAYAAYKRTSQGGSRTYPFSIIFNPQINTISLGSTLNVNVDKVTISGSSALTPVVLTTSTPLGEMVLITQNGVTLSDVALDGNNQVTTLFNPGDSDHTIMIRVTFKNVGNGQRAVMAPQSTSAIHRELRLFYPTFVNMASDSYGVDTPDALSKYVYIHRLNVEGTSFPSTLLHNLEAPPTIGQFTPFDLQNMTTTVSGNSGNPPQCDSISAYSAFSNRPSDLRLEASGVYYNPGYAGGAFQVTVNQFPIWAQSNMVHWGEFDLYFICTKKVAAAIPVIYYSSALTPKMMVIRDLATRDTDGDSIFDVNDNCPLDSNWDQATMIPTGAPHCLPDPDKDLIPNDGTDNCPTVTTNNQTDSDGDGIGDACDEDVDGDGICNPGFDNPQQHCTMNPDGSGDNCPYDYNPDQATMIVNGTTCIQDADKDGVRDDQDNCPTVANPDQKDTDGDGKGDACDDDSDGDGIANAQDNCPLVPNSDQKNTDSDPIGDACDDDSDGDGIANAQDNCPLVPNPDQKNTNGSAVGDACSNIPPPPKPIIDQHAVGSCTLIPY
jgi:hypothetical protein